MVEWEEIVEGLAHAFARQQKRAQPAFEILHGRARRDVAKEILPDDRRTFEVREPRFILVILSDRAVGIDDDRAERQLVELIEWQIERASNAPVLSLFVRHGRASERWFWQQKSETGARCP